MTTLHIDLLLEHADHRLLDEILERAKVALTIVDTQVLQLVEHLLAQFVDVFTALLHLKNTSIGDTLRVCDVELALELSNPILVLVLCFLSGLNNQFLLLPLEVSLIHDFDFEGLLVRVLTQHALHFESTHAHSQLDAEIGHLVLRGLVHIY